MLLAKEELARRANDKYLALFHHMDYGFCIIEVLLDQQPLDYRFLEVNPIFEKQTGLKHAVGMTMRELEPNHEEHWFEIYGQVASTGQAVHFENPASHLAGGVWYEVYAFPIGPSGGRQVAVLFNDISLRKQAEQQLKDFNALLEQQVQKRTAALRESKERFQAAIHVSPVVLCILKNIRQQQGQIQDFQFEWVSKSGEVMAGRDVTGLRLAEQFPQLRKIGVLDKFIRTAEGGKPTDEEYHYQADGLDLWVRWRAVRLEEGLFVSVEDLSDVKRLEKENLQMRLSQQKSLLLAILEAQEEERKRISESLHNGVGQILYAAKLNLGQVAQLVPRQVVQATEELLSQAIDETRRVSHQLVPVVLLDFGLAEALQDMCRQFQGGSLQLRCQVEGLGVRLDAYLEIALYRISQELVTNIAKHARATLASLHLARRQDSILLQVQDNGKGLARQAAQPKGLGLRTIRDRVKMLNGSLAIVPLKTGKGTLVTIRIPV